MDIGDGATQSWRVAQVLIEKVQYDSDGKLIARLKLHMPKEILDEIGNKMELVEAVTKLANMACDGPLKDCRNADERLERAKKFLPTAECETWSKQSCYAWVKVWLIRCSARVVFTSAGRRFSIPFQQCQHSRTG